jgi:hypothetical protein
VKAANTWVSRAASYLLAIGAVAGCAGVSSMSSDEVAKLTNLELCKTNERSPVGFIPLEIERRKLDCRTVHRAMLDEAIRGDAGVLYIPPAIPAGALNEADCANVRLGRVRTPYVTETRTESTVRGTSDSRFHQHVLNTSDSTVYVLFDLTFKDRGTSSGTKLISVPPRSDTVVRFGTFTTHVVRVSIAQCRIFAGTP